MAEVGWTNEAELWLRDIYDYITHDNPSAAARVVDGIYEKAQLLKEHSEIGYKYRSKSEGEIRILRYGYYRIGYLLAGDKSIDILGIFLWRVGNRSISSMSRHNQSLQPTANPLRGLSAAELGR